MIPLTISIDGVDKPLYVLRKISDHSIIRARTISNTLDLPVTDADSDTEYLPILIDEVPVYDADFQVLAHAEGPNDVKKQWEITYTVQDKTKEEQLKAVEDAKLKQVQLQAPVQVFTESTIIVVAAMLNAAKLDLTPEEQVDADAVLALAVKLKNNRAKAAADKAIVEAGGKPDIKGGWEVKAATADAVVGVLPP